MHFWALRNQRLYSNCYTARVTCDEFVRAVLISLITDLFAGDPARFIAYVQQHREEPATEGERWSTA
jgi:hypothetical protein